MKRVETLTKRIKFVDTKQVNPESISTSATRGLLIRSPWIERILQGSKCWEIRGSNTNVRGRIALIRSGSGKIVGTCDLMDVVGPLTLSELRENACKLGCIDEDPQSLPYEKTYAWVFKNPVPLEEPIPYKHPSGAIIWVKLPELELNDCSGQFHQSEQQLKLIYTATGKS